MEYGPHSSSLHTVRGILGCMFGRGLTPNMSLKMLDIDDKQIDLYGLCGKQVNLFLTKYAGLL